MGGRKFKFAESTVWCQRNEKQILTFSWYNVSWIQRRWSTVINWYKLLDLLLPRDYRKGRIEEPIAIKAVFGWILVGSDINVNCNFENFKNTNVYCNFTTNFDDLNKNICKLWEIESYGTLPKFALLPPYDQRALKFLENATKFKSGYY